MIFQLEAGAEYPVLQSPNRSLMYSGIVLFPCGLRRVYEVYRPDSLAFQKAACKQCWVSYFLKRVIVTSYWN